MVNNLKCMTGLKGYSHHFLVAAGVLQATKNRELTAIVCLSLLNSIGVPNEAKRMCSAVFGITIGIDEENPEVK